MYSYVFVCICMYLNIYSLWKWQFSHTHTHILNTTGGSLQNRCMAHHYWWAESPDWFIYIHMYSYVFICICMYLKIYSLWIWQFLHTRTHIQVYGPPLLVGQDESPCQFIYIHMYPHVNICICMYLNKYSHEHDNFHTHAHTHTKYNRWIFSREVYGPPLYKYTWIHAGSVSICIYTVWIPMDTTGGSFQARCMAHHCINTLRYIRTMDQYVFIRYKYIWIQQVDVFKRGVWPTTHLYTFVCIHTYSYILRYVQIHMNPYEYIWIHMNNTL